MDSDGTQRLFSLREILGERTPKIDILDIGAMLEGEERYAPLRRALDRALLRALRPAADAADPASRHRVQPGVRDRDAEVLLGVGAVVRGAIQR